MEPPWRVCFFGTDEFALEHLKKLHENQVAGDVKLVKSLDVVIPKSGKCIVGDYAERWNIRCMQWPIPSMVGTYDVGIVVSFGHLIPRSVIDSFPFGILNIHPSILPRWRGASPIIHTILNGDRETGISVMEIRPIHFDVGPLLLQSRFVIPDDCSTFQLRDYLSVEGSHMMMHALRDLPRLEKMEYEQNESGVTYAHKLSPVNARINWEEQSLTDIDRQYRALNEIYQLRSMWNKQKVKLLDMVPYPSILDSLEETFPEDEMTLRPGSAHYLKSHDILCIRCRDAWVGFGGIILKKPLSAKSFYNGYLSKYHLRSMTFDSMENALDKYTFRTTVSKSSLKTRAWV
ncbi:hypothetical protein HELRODRAFT_68612 [Helobdella robusta]|uniref:Methionyl-tRNA formyltransferase, mitochondrial n=1 Tax=Helobdella robusta TaxID=6412 RepID=T1FZH3_HELRO|nr:hypothetical protein HELRODRAFT_68612 [Helobdella robusta]ESN94616.1 hypothetical protein HELRODRAFT_68612 [Helobdella robusta]